MRVLVLVEHHENVLHPGTRCVLAVAKELDAELVLLVAGGEGCAVVASEAATLPGVSDVLLAEHACYQHTLPEAMAPLVASLATAFDYVLMAATTAGKNWLPRIAALLDVSQVSDVIRVVDANTFEHPIYAGNAIETVSVLDACKVLSVRTTAFEPVLGSQAACAIQRCEHVVTQSMSHFLRHESQVSTRPSLNRANVVVAGGRGLKSSENFKLIEKLADKLGAAVGASRAAVDAGYVSNDHQVGQTGQIVAPQLYIAVGISGAVQHVAGMKDSKIIVAINQDPDAPIFQWATYGLVGDLFDILPQWIGE